MMSSGSQGRLATYTKQVPRLALEEESLIAYFNQGPEFTTSKLNRPANRVASVESFHVLLTFMFDRVDVGSGRRRNVRSRSGETKQTRPGGSSYGRCGPASGWALTMTPQLVMAVRPLSEFRELHLIRDLFKFLYEHFSYAFLYENAIGSHNYLRVMIWWPTCSPVPSQHGLQRFGIVFLRMKSFALSG